MTNEASSLPMTRKPSLWKTAAYIVLSLLLLAAILKYFRKDWLYLVAHPAGFWQVHYGFVVLSLLVLLLTSLFDILMWNRMLGWFTTPLPFRLAMPVYIWSYLARYIPGKVGSLLLRVGLAADAKRNPVPVLAASAVELALRTASALVLFLLVLWGWAGAHYHWLRYVLVGLVPFVLLCAHPKVMLPVLNWLLKKMKQPRLPDALRYREVLGLFLLQLGRWTLFGMAFLLLVYAIRPPIPALQAKAMSLIGLAPGSWAIGFLSMLPGGAGSMEAVLKAVLTGALHVDAAVAFILVIQLRLLTLAGEGLWSLAAIPVWRASKRLVEPTPQPATPLPSPE